MFYLGIGVAVLCVLQLVTTGLLVALVRRLPQMPASVASAKQLGKALRTKT